MATDVHKGVLSQILLKRRLKMTDSSNACQSLKITAEDLKLLGMICRKTNLYLGGPARF